MFSPYYVWAGRDDPDNHCAINVALYGPGIGRWSMTERGRNAVSRDATSLTIGPSGLRWDGNALTISIDEWAVPVPRRLRGRVRLVPGALASARHALDPHGRHRWMPIAPNAHVEVDFVHPASQWHGHGYWDTNAGDEPMQRAFRAWDWSRADLGGQSAVLYDTVARDGSRRSLALHYDRHGEVEAFEPPPRLALPSTRWRLPRATQADAEKPVTLRRTLEDTPFYARSELVTHLLGQSVPAVHESLSLTRLDTKLVRLMLPWRMPRTFW